MILDPLPAAAIHLFVALLFAGGVWHKLRAYDQYRVAVAGYLPVPLRGVWTEATAVLALAAEIAIVLLCILPATATPAAIGAAALLLLYGAAMALSLASGRAPGDCGCTWGREPHPVTRALVVRNVALAALAALAALSMGAGTPAGAAGWLNAGIAAILAVTLYAAAGQLLANADLLKERPI